jgi:hypothetical protein
MNKENKKLLKELEAFSQKFWLDFKDYYSSDNIAKRIEKFTERLKKF